MRKKIVAAMVIACLIVVSLSTFAWSRMQALESKGILIQGTIKEKDASGTDTGIASGSNVPENGNRADGSSTTQSEQTLNKNENTLCTDDVNQNQASNLPTPLPDGRIFLQPGAGTEDPIAYIPTQNPKTGSTIPIEPPELGS